MLSVFGIDKKTLFVFCGQVSVVLATQSFIHVQLPLKVISYDIYLHMIVIVIGVIV